MILLLFVIALAIFGVMFAAEFITTDSMPFTCPACFYGGDRDLADQARAWFTKLSAERVRCRHCGKTFREHANGSLVEERD